MKSFYWLLFEESCLFDICFFLWRILVYGRFFECFELKVCDLLVKIFKEKELINLSLLVFGGGGWELIKFILFYLYVY